MHNKTINLCLFKDKFALFIAKSKMYLLTFILIKLYFKLKKAEIK